jgi:hypothetical protein
MGQAEELRAVEADCIARFRRRAQELRQADPSLSADRAFYEAVRTLPLVAGKYHYARTILSDLGIVSLPLR